MRPSVLNPLFASASGIKGIGQKLDKVLANQKKIEANQNKILANQKAILAR